MTDGAALRRSPIALALVAGGLGVLPAVLGVWIDARLMFTVCAIAALVIAALRYRLAAAVVTLAFLPFLGLVRRLLIPVTGWPQYDPLLLIAPVVVLTLFLLALYEGRLHWRSTPLAYWVALFTTWAVVEMFNPQGLAGNIAGGMYVVVPLLWFFVGRTYGSLDAIRKFLVYVLCASVAVALYGLYQTFVGFPPWDRAWLRIGGYAALHVGGAVRAFGTLPSSAEYGFLLGIGVVTAFTILVRGGSVGRRWAPALLPAIALLGVALFLESQRSALIYSFGGCGLVWVLGAQRRRSQFLRLAAAVVVTVVAYVRLAHALPAVASGGTLNGLIRHNTQFLVDPFGRDSTLPGHLHYVVAGLLAGLHRPWGYGLGAISVGGKLGGGYGASGTEFDLSNAVTGGGLVGGLLFLPAWVSAWLRVGRAARLHWVFAAALGALLALFGNWINGGLYFVSAFIWFSIGVVDGVATEPEVPSLVAVQG